MKNVLRFFGILYITALFGSVVFVATKSLEKEVQNDYSRKAEENVAPTFSKSIICFIHASQNSNYGISNLAFFKTKIPLHLGVSFDKISESVLQRKLSQYLNFSKHFLIRHRKTNIIFPFHSHW